MRFAIGKVSCTQISTQRLLCNANSVVSDNEPLGAPEPKVKGCKILNAVFIAIYGGFYFIFHEIKWVRGYGGWHV